MAAGAVAVAAHAGGPPVVPPQYAIAPSAVADFDAFGASVALDGGFCVAGVRGLDAHGVNSGGAWVLAESGTGWDVAAVLVPASSAAREQFGAAVALSADLAFVGSLDAESAVGGDPAFVSVFQNTGAGWVERASLTAEAPASSGFGSVLAADGDVVVVGAPLYDLSVRDEGAVFVYRRLGSTPEFLLEATLVAPDAFENDRFGAAVSISGDRIVVGAPRDDDGGIDCGAVWVFERTAEVWTAAAKVIRAESDWYAGFGSAVAIDGDLIAVGAPRDDLASVDDGAVRTYLRSSSGAWELDGTFAASGSSVAGRETGDAVSLDGDRLVIGMPADSVMGSQAGAVATWRRVEGAWVAESEVRSAEVTGLALLGAAVAADDGRVLIGVPVDSAFGQYAGSVASLDLRADCDVDATPDYIAIAAGLAIDCNDNGQPDTCDLDQGVTVDCNGNGIPDECDLDTGIALDCDANGVLDVCQIDDGSAADCNGNGLIDDCEVADGSGEDLNRDEVLDECPGQLVFEVPLRFLDIGKAIAAAPDGSLVKVGVGTYFEAIDYLGKAITIEGDPANPASVILDGTEVVGVSVVRFVNGEGPDSVLRGVTIRNGTSGTLFGAAYVGGGVHTLDSSPVIEDCIFEANSSSYGGAVYARRGGPRFLRCVFEGNSALVDGGAFQFSRTEGGVLEDCAFVGNLAGNNGGAVHLYGGDPTILRASMLDNTAAGGGGAVSWASTGESALVTGSVVSGNDAMLGGGIWIAEASADLVLADSTVCSNTPSQVEGAFGDGAGNCISAVCDTDADGTLDCEDGCPEDPDKIAPGVCGCGIADEGDLDGDGILDCVDPCPSWPYECSEDGTTIVVAPGQSIALAISKVPTGGTLRLLPGVHSEAVNFGGRQITIEGNAGDPSLVVLDGEGLSGAVVTAATGEGPGSVLRGVTVRNGVAGSPLPSDPATLAGGGLFCFEASPLIEDCIFESNRSSLGGGLFARLSAVTLRRCVFRTNEASSYGGGVNLSQCSGAVVEDCLFDGNFTNASGGGLHGFRGDLIVHGCVFQMNESLQPGGGVSWDAGGDGTCLLDQCDIRFNQTSSASGGGVATLFGTSPAVALRDSVVCDNEPDQISGSFQDLGGNDVCVCVGDLSGDGVVSGTDLGLLLVYAGSTCDPGGECPGDLNGDGEVSGADLGLLLVGWGPCD